MELAKQEEKKTRRGSVPFREKLEKIDQQIKDAKAWVDELQKRRTRMVQERAAEIQQMQDELAPTTMTSDQGKLLGGQHRPPTT